jgi:hypothetical protein
MYIILRVDLRLDSISSHHLPPLPSLPSSTISPITFNSHHTVSSATEEAAEDQVTFVRENIPIMPKSRKWRMEDV